MICFQISIFEPLETTYRLPTLWCLMLWFAFKLVSLNHWKQPLRRSDVEATVVICFQISIFEPLETTKGDSVVFEGALWFAFKLVSLNHWKQLLKFWYCDYCVVICFQISIFEPLETTPGTRFAPDRLLWFAFKLVSLNHWKQPRGGNKDKRASCDLLSN